MVDGTPLVPSLAEATPLQERFLAKVLELKTAEATKDHEQADRDDSRFRELMDQRARDRADRSA